MRQASTWTQQLEVRALAARGLSVRAIATLVFGEARLKGRVERILARTPTGLELATAEVAAAALERGITVEAAIAADSDDLDELVAALETEIPELDA